MVVPVSSLEWAVVVILNEGTRCEQLYCAGLCATSEIAETVGQATEADYFCCSADGWDPETGFDWLSILVVPTSELGDYGISIRRLVGQFEFGVATKQGELIAAVVGYEEDEVLAYSNEDWMPVPLGDAIRLAA